MNNKQNIDQFFDQFFQRLQQVQQHLPDIVGTETVNSALDNFKDQSFEGEKWPARKDKKNKRPLLVNRGILRRSVGIMAKGHNWVSAGSPLVHASIHNYGGTINRAERSELFTRNRHKKGKLGKMFGGMGAFRKGTSPGKGMTFKAYSISMPRRQFLGATPKLKMHLENVIKEEIVKALN